MNKAVTVMQGTSPTRSLRSGTDQVALGSPFAVASQQRALGDQYEEANAHTWTSGITGSGCGPLLADVTVGYVELQMQHGMAYLDQMMSAARLLKVVLTAYGCKLGMQLLCRATRLARELRWHTEHSHRSKFLQRSQRW